MEILFILRSLTKQNSQTGGGEGLIDFMNGLVHSESISFVEILF